MSYLLFALLFALVDIMRGRAARKAAHYAIALLVVTIVVLLVPWFYELANVAAASP